MKHVYIIVGYGVPKDIFKDENYNFYLKIAFNKIYNQVIREKVRNPLFIFSGGKTGMYKPYMKSEGGEMKKLFASLARRSFVRQMTRDWELVVEQHAISSVENLVFSADILKKRHIRRAYVHLVHEYTRSRRLRVLGRRVFVGHRMSNISVDFDISANRYLDHEFLRKKDTIALKYELRALRDPEVFAWYHTAHAERLAYLRHMGPKRHTEAVEQWWNDRLMKFNIK